MKRIVIVLGFLLSIISLNVNAQNSAILSNGKAIPIRLTSEIYSNSKYYSEPTAIIDADIKDDNGTNIVIKRGTPVNISSTITKAKGLGKPAYIKLDFISTTSVDGQTISLLGGLTQEGESKRGVALGVGLGLGIPICWPCLFCLCIKGEKITIPANTIFQNVVVNDKYIIEL